ncbi:hypothetical protein SEA_EFFIE_680 [Acinetobacter phage Effie]|nr:hypothetical protein SEA_EFFIE_680 [Acinetobacter phage Effie]
MIDLYVIQPDDKQGIQIDFQCKSTIENLADLMELCKKNHLLISSVNVENEHTGWSERSIKLVYMNGSMIQIELKHGQIVFYDDNQLKSCTEQELEELFGLTMNYRKANRYDD